VEPLEVTWLVATGADVPPLPAADEVVSVVELEPVDPLCATCVELLCAWLLAPDDPELLDGVPGLGHAAVSRTRPRVRLGWTRRMGERIGVRHALVYGVVTQWSRRDPWSLTLKQAYGDNTTPSLRV